MYRTGMANYISWPICGTPGAVNVNPGLSGCGCGCSGGCNKGLGYFDSGFDISGWGWMEWGTVAIAAYMLVSTFREHAAVISAWPELCGRRGSVPARPAGRGWSGS